MFQKIKVVGKALVVWGGIFLAITLFPIYQDIRTNKLLNYNETYSASQIDVKTEYESATSLKYIFKIKSHDNYLGSISFNYFRLKGNPGQVIFRIKDTSQNDWYAQNRYDFSYFNNEADYQFGFPEIVDSKEKSYDVEFEITSPNLSDQIGILDLEKVPILTVKYVFPRDTYYKFPAQLATILFHRSLDILKQNNYLKLGGLSGVLATFLLLALFRPKSSQSVISEIRHADIEQRLTRINPFYIPAVVFLVLVFAFVSGNFVLAERMAVNLWLTFFGSVIFFILQGSVFHRLAMIGKIVDSLSINVITILDDLITKKTLIIIGTLFILISGFSTTYYLGGDDSRLFYLYPQEFLQNFTTKIVSDTGVSQLTNWIPPSSLSAFTVLMISLKKVLPLFNLQAILNSANLIGGFFAFYALSSYFLRPQTKYDRVILILSSFIYVFSIYNFYTLLNSRLIAEHLISLFPLTLLFGIRAVREGKLYLLITSVLIWSVFGFVSVTFPISAAALITSLPLLIFATWRFKARLILYSIVAVMLFAVLNMHWLVFVPYTNFSQNLPGSNTPNITSTEFREQNSEGISQVTKINNSFFPLLNSFHQKIQLNFNWPQLPIYLSWYSQIIGFGLLLIGTVITAGMVIEKDKEKKNIYIVSIFGFVLAIYFFTVNVGPWGISIFLWLSNHVPGFVIFRNMYDKFAYAISLQWAMVLVVSLTIVTKSIGLQKYKNYLLFAVFLIAIMNAKPFLLGEFESLPYWTSQHSYDGIKNFNADYQNLLEFVKNHDTRGRYLSLPLLTGNSVIVQDESNRDHYYAGVSPLLLLTGKNDMSGLISFAEYASEVFVWLTNKDFDSFGKLLQKYNVRHVIVSKNTPDDLQNSFMFSDGLFALQSKEFIASIIGKKIQDFGSRYSIYEINPDYKSEKIYISDSPETFSNRGANLAYRKNAAHSYDLQISDLSDQRTLVFLDPYLERWQLLTTSGKQVGKGNHHLALGYANMWEIDPSIVRDTIPESDYALSPDGSMQLNLRLYFQPYDYLNTVNLISTSAYILGIFYVLLSLKRAMKK